MKFAPSCQTLLSHGKVHRILQARTLEWIAIPFSRGSSHTRDRTQVSCIAGRFLPAEPSRKPKVKVTGAQSCPILCDLTDYTVHGILQARILEWVAFPFFRDLPNPGFEHRPLALHVDSLPAEPQGKPKCLHLPAQTLSHVRLFVTPWTAARQAPLSMGFSRQE